MSTNFPSSLDSYTTKATDDTIVASHVNDLQDAVTALETKVGATSSAVTSSLDYKVTNASSSNPGHVHTTAAITDFASAVQAYACPTGMVGMWGNATPPTGWLLADGSAVSRTTYASLFAVYGTSFGAGDTSTTFNLPNFSGRAPIGVGANTWTTTFASADVNTGTDVITVPSNNTLYTGTKIRLTTSGTLPTGLSLATDYYVVRLTATTIKLASSRQNALGSTTTTGASSTPTVIDITAAGSGTHTITVQDLSTRTLGERFGEETHTQTIEELVSHAHVQAAQAGTSSGSGGSPQTNNNPTQATGGSTPFNLMNPYLGIYFIVKT